MACAKVAAAEPSTDFFYFSECGIFTSEVFSSPFLNSSRTRLSVFKTTMFALRPSLRNATGKLSLARTLTTSAPSPVRTLLRNTAAVPARMQAQRLGVLMAQTHPWRTATAGTQLLRRCYSMDAAQEEASTPTLTVEHMMPVENIRNIAIIGMWSL